MLGLSRLIVLDDVYDLFVERFLSGLPGPAVAIRRNPHRHRPGDRCRRQKKSSDSSNEGKKEAKLAFQGMRPATGYFIRPPSS